MAIFNTIANIANKVLRFVDDSDKGSQIVSSTSSNNAILSFDGEKPVDKLEIKGKKDAFETEMQIKRYQDVILQRCQNTGLQAAEILSRLLKYTCMTPEEYNNLTNEEKLTLWQGFAQIVESAVNVKDKYGVSKGTNPNTVINQMLDVYQADQSHGNIVEAQDVLDLAGDVNAEIKDKNLKDKSREEKFGIVGKMYNALADKISCFENEKLKGLEGDVKTHRQRLIDKAKDKAEKLRLLQLQMTQDPESAFLGLLSVSSKQLAWGTKALLDSRISAAERMRVADEVMTFDNQANIIEKFCERGDKPTNEAVRGMTTASVSEMSENGVKAFSQSYDESRSSGKYHFLEENGYYTQIAGGIGAGATLNKNMSEEAKAAFVEEFLANEEKYGDVSEVKQVMQDSINEYIKEYSKSHTPEETAKLSDSIQKTQKYIEEKLSINNTNNKNNNLKNTNNQNKKNITSFSDEITSFIESDVDDKPEQQIDKVTTKPKKVTQECKNQEQLTLNGKIAKRPHADITEIKRSVRGGIPLSIAMDMYPKKEFAKFCVGESSASSFLSRLDSVITTTKPSELAGWHASIAGYNYIVKTLSPSDAEKYITLKPMSITVKKIAQNRVEERKKEEDKKNAIS